MKNQIRTPKNSLNHKLVLGSLIRNVLIDLSIADYRVHWRELLFII